MMNYIFILGLSCIFIYIIVRMIQKRQNQTDTTPPYTDVPTNAQTSQLMRVQTTTGSGISNFHPNLTVDNSIRNFYIKSSFNSAYTGGYVNLEMIKYVLTRGCRFLDFQVFIKDDIPIVAYSDDVTDSSFSHFTSKSAVSLEGVLSTIISNAFTDTSPNPKDPLFIQLHINTLLPGAYDDIASIIHANLKDRLHNGIVDINTQLTDLMGKIVLIVDNLTSPGYQNHSSCTISNCVNLKNLVNMDSGTSMIRIYNEADLMMQSFNPPDPGVYMIRIILPSKSMLYGITNPNYSYLMKNYGAQIVTMAFYKNDTRLASYEEMFRNAKSAFVHI